MIEIRPLEHYDEVVTIPGSKSYTHRALLLSSLADGESILMNADRCEDTECTAQALIRFGASVSWKNDRARVTGNGGRVKAGDERIDVGNSGSSMRFLTALSALRKGVTLVDGSERMRKRPIGELLNGLGDLGVKAYSQKGDGCPPVIVESQGLKGGKTSIRGEESSQFLSSLLMVAPFAKRDVRIEMDSPLASRPYVDITLDAMSCFGVTVENRSYGSFFVKAGQRYLPREFWIEGDASSASYFFSAAAICKGKVRVENLNPNTLQGDIRFLEVLERMGCEVTRGKDWIEVSGRGLHGIEMDMNATPDIVPTLAVTAAFASGKTLIRNIGHIRHKESDRIHTLITELSKMGIRAGEGKDWLEIEGGNPHGAEIDTHADHRVAMSFAVAGLAVPGVKIRGEEYVNKSFPGFWEELQKLSKK